MIAMEQTGNGAVSQKIGIMGGTFDPIHYGHLLIAQSAAEEFALDQVLFLPTGRSPHKSEKDVTDPQIRCEMVQIALEDNRKFEISMLEAENTEVNYTYASLQKLKQLYPKAQLYFIMGEDSLDDFPTWKKPEEICRLSTVLVAVRNDKGFGISDKIAEISQMYQADMHMLHAPNFSVSSHDIRKRIHENKSVRYMLPDKLTEYIVQHDLYRE